MDERCKEIEDLNKRDQQQMYERVKELTNKRKPNNNKAIKNTEGNIIMEREEIMKVWAQYIATLFDDIISDNFEINNNEEGPPIIRSEIEAAMKKMKGKTTGNDGIAIEMLNALEEYSAEIITEIAKEIYENGETPPQLCKSTFITIPKIPGTLDCNKHRLISIMNQTTKIILRVVLNRIRNKILPEIGNEQFGFRKEKGTRNAIFILRMLMESHGSQQRTIHLLCGL